MLECIRVFGALKTEWMCFACENMNVGLQQADCYGLNVLPNSYVEAITYNVSYLMAGSLKGKCYEVPNPISLVSLKEGGIPGKHAHK